MGFFNVGDYDKGFFDKRTVLLSASARVEAEGLKADVCMLEDTNNWEDDISPPVLSIENVWNLNIEIFLPSI